MPINHILNYSGMKKETRLMLAVFFIMMWSCEDIVEVPDISDQIVPILAPRNGGVLNYNTVRFNWQAINDASSYNIQIATPNFGNATQIVLDSIVRQDTLGNVVTQINQNLPNGNYVWRVKALNSDFETVYTLSSFQVDGGNGELDMTPPSAPQLTAPANGTSRMEAQVNFSWTREDISGTMERDGIFIFSDEDLQNLSLKALGTDKTYMANIGEGIFYWFVRAYDAAGNESAASSIFNFTITN